MKTCIKKTRKILVIMLLATIVLNIGIPGFIQPLMLFAATETDYNFTDELSEDREEEGFTWIASTKTLKITKIIDTNAVLELPEGSIIDIKGNATNKIKGIKSEKLTIKGNDDASLNTTGCCLMRSGHFAVINCSDLNIESGNININITLSGIYNFYGIYADNVTINGGKINIDLNGKSSYGIYTDNLSISDAYVNILTNGYAINGIDNTTKVNGAALIATSYNQAIYGDILMNGGTVRAISIIQQAVYGDITINEGSVTAMSNGNITSSGKEAINGNVSINGGSIIAIGGRDCSAFSVEPSLNSNIDWKIRYNESAKSLEEAIEGDIDDISNIYTSRMVQILTKKPTTSIAIIDYYEEDTLVIGEKYFLTTNVEPIDSTDEIVWSTSNENIATVYDNGEVTAIAPGKVTITATSGEYSDTKDINIVCAITLDANGVVTIESPLLYTDTNGKLIKDLPVLYSDDREFNKWIDSNGVEVTKDTIFTTNTTIYADWAEYKLGDITGDKEINARDAKLAIQYFTGKIELTEIEKQAADVNKDGEVNARDAKLMIQFFTGKINKF